MNAQDVFDSFPDGLFDSFTGIQVTGKVKYHLHVFLDSSNPDKVQFESSLAKDNLRIVKYGKTDLGKLNNVFTYVPYEKGKPMPPRIIGPQNPDFTPLRRYPTGYTQRGNDFRGPVILHQSWLCGGVYPPIHRNGYQIKKI